MPHHLPCHLSTATATCHHATPAIPHSPGGACTCHLPPAIPATGVLPVDISILDVSHLQTCTYGLLSPACLSNLSLPACLYLFTACLSGCLWVVSACTGGSYTTVSVSHHHLPTMSYLVIFYTSHQPCGQTCHHYHLDGDTCSPTHDGQWGHTCHYNAIQYAWVAIREIPQTTRVSTPQHCHGVPLGLCRTVGSLTACLPDSAIHYLPFCVPVPPVQDAVPATLPQLDPDLYNTVVLQTHTAVLYLLILHFVEWVGLQWLVCTCPLLCNTYLHILPACHSSAAPANLPSCCALACCCLLYHFGCAGCACHLLLRITMPPAACLTAPAATYSTTAVPHNPVLGPAGLCTMPACCTCWDMPLLTVNCIFGQPSPWRDLSASLLPGVNTCRTTACTSLPAAMGAILGSPAMPYHHLPPPEPTYACLPPTLSLSLLSLS